MPDTSAEAESIDSLLEQFSQAQKQRRTARYLMTLLIAFIVLIFIYLMIKEVQDFQDNQVGAFAEALALEADAIRPMVMHELSESANRAAPAIQNAFVEVFTDNQEEYVTVLTDNYVALQGYAQARWPLIQDGLAELVMTQEETARATLAQYVPEDKLTMLSNSYNKAMTNYLDHFFADNFAGDMATAQTMLDNLQKLSEEETDMPPENSQYVMGMFLELLGLEMQQSSLDQ